MSDNIVLSTPLFDVLESTNTQSKQVYVKRRPTVIVIALTENREVYLVSQTRKMLGRKTLETTAGFIEKNETPENAAIRELAEETGLSAKKWTRLGELDLTASTIDGKEFIFLAEELIEGEQNLQDDEDISIVRILLAEAVKKVKEGEINTSGSALGILLAEKHVKQYE